MHRVDSTCHWCGEVKRPAPLELITSRRAAAAAIAMLVGIGAWRSGPMIRSLRSELQQDRVLLAPVAPVAPVVSVISDGEAGRDAAVQQANTRAGDSIATTAAMVADSIVWTPAVARTWVNVRSDASRGGQVVGVIKPAARAMLGTDRAGWRQVRSPEISGWVDPRLFESDSANTRGQ
jgi:hypothetical protein